MTSTVPDPTDTLPLLVDLVHRSGKRPVLVGIDGQGGAGKSRLALQLAARMPRSVVVEGDDFYRDLPDDARVLLDAEQGAEQYVDWQRLRREVLEPVARGEPVLRYQRYDWARAAMGGWVEVPMPEVVVVEGVYTLRPQLRDLVDVKVYVEASAQVRRQRQRDRGENPDDWIERWVAAEDVYVARTAPQAAADLVVQSG
jgi:uridine kinase